MAETRINWPRLMNEALTAPGNLGNTYSRFHEYSITNELMFFMQGVHEPVASASRWKELGRTIADWSQSKEVIVPRFIKEQEPESTEDELEVKRERVAKLIGFAVVRAVFPLSATNGPEIPPQPIPGWNEAAALAKLGIKQVPFDSTNGNLQGWSRGTEFAINPIAVKPDKTKFHEWAHILLGHTPPHRYQAIPGTPRDYGVSSRGYRLPCYERARANGRRDDEHEPRLH